MNNLLKLFFVVVFIVTPILAVIPTTKADATPSVASLQGTVIAARITKAAADVASANADKTAIADVAALGAAEEAYNASLNVVDNEDVVDARQAVVTQARDKAKESSTAAVEAGRVAEEAASALREAERALAAAGSSTDEKTTGATTGGTANTGNAGGGTANTGKSASLESGFGSDLFALANKAANLGLNIMIALATLIVLYGAYQMMTAYGNPSDFEKGKNTIKYAAIGVAVATLSKIGIQILSSVIQGLAK